MTTPQTPTQTKAPSFMAIYGRKPVAGQDYDPSAPMCQDDYEFYSGTGAYSDQAPTQAPTQAPVISLVEFAPEPQGWDQTEWDYRQDYGPDYPAPRPLGSNFSLEDFAYFADYD